MDNRSGTTIAKNDDLMFGYIPAHCEEAPQEEPAFEMPVHEEPDMTSGCAVFEDGYLIGCRDGAEVVKAGPYPDIAAAKAAFPLYDAEGNVINVTRRLSVTEKVEEQEQLLDVTMMASVELYEKSLKTEQALDITQLALVELFEMAVNQ